ncbi:hypothetical protein BJ166DRAFT_280212 [Pestalotiopsis sp. NC0098]|nr:hypothetical protein BJ166DRAFT_280212 [Pestalotiopsis sp. NC0098]
MNQIERERAESNGHGRPSPAHAAVAAQQGGGWTSINGSHGRKDVGRDEDAYRHAEDGHGSIAFTGFFPFPLLLPELRAKIIEAYLDDFFVRRGQKVQSLSGNGGDSFTQLPVIAFVSREWRAETLRSLMITTVQGRSRYIGEKELAPTVVNPAGDLFFLRAGFHGAYPASVRVMLSEANKDKSSLVVSRFRLQQITMSVPRHNRYKYNGRFPKSVMGALYAAFKIIGVVGGQLQWLQPGVHVMLSEAQNVAVPASTVLSKRQYHSGAIKKALASGGILEGLKEVSQCWCRSKGYCFPTQIATKSLSVVCGQPHSLPNGESSSF